MPDAGLIACCYWEYARELVLLRDVKQRWDKWNGSQRFLEALGRGINRIQHAPTVVLYVMIEATISR